MESYIKMKATSEQAIMFSELCCVKRCEWIKWLNDGKRRNLYDVMLRHADDIGELRGTYTVETLLKKCRQDAMTNLSGNIRRKVKDIVNVLSFLGEGKQLVDELNKALKEYGLKVKAA